MLQKKTLSGQLASRCKAFSVELESLIGPLLVFCVCYCHHIYFAHHLISSVFIVTGLLSLVSVHAFAKGGLIASALLQCTFLAWTAFFSGEFFLEQAAFSASLFAALFASHANQLPLAEQAEEKEVVEKEVVDSEDLSIQKQQLWQQLFDARQEITLLYQQKLEKEQAQSEAVATSDRIELLEHQLEAATLHKDAIVEEKALAEEEIARLLNDLREMAERQAEVPIASEKLPFEAKYRQLQQQFQSKSATLDQTRKELFFACEEIEVLKRTLLEREMQSPSEEEKRLHHALIEVDQKLEAATLKYQEDLAEYENMIQGLYQQLESK